MAKHIKVHISSALSEKEWQMLRAFCDKSRRLVATKLVSGHESSIHGNIRYEQDKGLWFDAAIPPEEQIAEFLMAFRFFYLQKELTYFPNILKLIGRHASQPEVRQALKIFRRQWESSLFKKAMQISLNGKPITSSLLLDLWFNAHYFHSDNDKGAELQSLRETFFRKLREIHAPRFRLWGNKGCSESL